MRRRPPGTTMVPEDLLRGFEATARSPGFEDPDDLARAEDVIVGAASRDKHAEIEAVEQVLDQLRAAVHWGHACEVGRSRAPVG